MTYPWQAEIYQRLTTSVVQQRLPQALLLIGTRGIGKQYLAEQLAGALLCEQGTESGRACGQCSACHLYLQGNHADYYLYTREGV